MILIREHDRLHAVTRIDLLQDVRYVCFDGGRELSAPGRHARSALLHEMILIREHDRLHAVTRIDLLQDVRYVCFDGGQ